MSETNKISMSKGMKIWLWFALVLRAFTTIVNLTSGLYLTVALAAGTVVGLCMMLFARKDRAFIFYASAIWQHLLKVSIREWRIRSHWQYLL